MQIIQNRQTMKSKKEQILLQLRRRYDRFNLKCTLLLPPYAALLPLLPLHYPFGRAAVPTLATLPCFPADFTLPLLLPLPVLCTGKVPVSKVRVYPTYLPLRDLSKDRRTPYPFGVEQGLRSKSRGSSRGDGAKVGSVPPGSYAYRWSSQAPMGVASKGFVFTNYSFLTTVAHGSLRVTRTLIPNNLASARHSANDRNTPLALFQQPVAAAQKKHLKHLTVLFMLRTHLKQLKSCMSGRRKLLASVSLCSNVFTGDYFGTNHPPSKRGSFKKNPVWPIFQSGSSKGRRGTQGIVPRISTKRSSGNRIVSPLGGLQSRGTKKNSFKAQAYTQQAYTQQDLVTKMSSFINIWCYLQITFFFFHTLQQPRVTAPISMNVLAERCQVTRENAKKLDRRKEIVFFFRPSEKRSGKQKMLSPQTNTFYKYLSFCDYIVFKMMWKWCSRKFSNQNAQWIRCHYFYKLNGQSWVFALKKILFTPS